MLAGTRDVLSCMDRHQPTGPHGHVSGPLVKFDMGHYFRIGHDLLVQEATWTGNTTVHTIRES